ncbi:MAG: methyltransferase domain-containing protein [Candidatus Aenigmarchaeota archaeon]|nr:methyltransferase domain-containing protein [Candidatus Aenigmarchaeota archaeon]
MYLIYLSGLFPKLAEAEAETKLKLLSCSYEKKWPFIFFDTNKNKIANLDKLGMAHSVHKILTKTKKSRIYEKIASMPKIRKKFAVRIKTINQKISEKDKKKITDAVWNNSTKRVDLENPEKIITIFILTKDIIITEKMFDIDKGFLKPSAPYRKPITLDPRIARAMANLTGLRHGCVLDPFCGTGLLLKEAGIVGLRCYGSDMSKEMIEGAKKNFSYFKLRGIFKQGDATDLKRVWKRTFDAVVTDPPYGISTSLFKKNVVHLYSKSIESIYEVTKPDGKIVIVVPDKITKTFIKKVKKIGLEIKYMIYQRVHKSLSRYFFVLKKLE